MTKGGEVVLGLLALVHALVACACHLDSNQATGLAPVGGVGTSNCACTSGGCAAGLAQSQLFIDDGMNAVHPVDIQNKQL